MLHVMLLALKNQTYVNGKRARLTGQSCCIIRYIQLDKYLHICIPKKWQEKFCCYITISCIVFLLKVSQC